MRSCIYDGYTSHRRLRPSVHEFRYRVAWLYLNLDELPELLRELSLLSRSRWSVASFQAADHLDEEQLNEFENDLPAFIRAQVEAAGAEFAGGPVCVLTPLRHFGFYFSPLSLFYCWNQSESKVPTVVAEVNNTPWRQKHWYVLGNQNLVSNHTSLGKVGNSGGLSSTASGEKFCHQKQFHVSPFMDMNQQYQWTVSKPGENLNVSIQSHDEAGQIFAASLRLERRQLSNSSFSRMVLRYPMAPIQILGSIYLEAFRLWRKGLPYFPNPSTT